VAVVVAAAVTVAAAAVAAAAAHCCYCCRLQTALALKSSHDAYLLEQLLLLYLAQSFLMPLLLPSLVLLHA
jgi:hypothetical protein